MCDLAVASSEARFAVSGVNLGLFCSTPSVALSRNLPRKAAFEMLVTGDFIGAEQAQALGLVNRVAAPADLDAAVAALVDRIAVKPRVALSMGKALFYRQLENRHRSRLRRCRAHDGLQHDGRQRAGRRAGLHRQAPAELARLSHVPAPPADKQPGFLATRWRGLLPLPRLLWREMLGWGTAVNLAFSALALALLAAGLPGWGAVLLHFAPLPWKPVHRGRGVAASRGAGAQPGTGGGLAGGDDGGLNGVARRRRPGRSVPASRRLWP